MRSRGKGKSTVVQRWRTPDGKVGGSSDMRRFVVISVLLLSDVALPLFMAVATDDGEKGKC
jgi:hypothetical protein